MNFFLGSNRNMSSLFSPPCHVRVNNVPSLPTINEPFVGISSP